jgi:hypothetical protein
MCTAPAAPRRSAPVHVSPQPLPHRFPASRWLLLASPRRPTARPSRPSPLLAVVAIPRHLLLPGDPTRHSPAVPPPSRPCAISHPRSPRRIAAARVSPCRHARRRRDSTCFRATTFPLRPRTHPDAPHALVLAFAHTHSTQFLCSDHLPPPDLRRRPWPSSTAAHITPKPRSSVARAPP